MHPLVNAHADMLCMKEETMEDEMQGKCTWHMLFPIYAPAALCKCRALIHTKTMGWAQHMPDQMQPWL